jgi:hypothetical protein
LASQYAQDGLVVDRETANVAVHRWLREVANARVHATTAAVPSERLESERSHLQSLPAPYADLTERRLPLLASKRPILGFQHPLALYDAVAGVVT